MDRDGVINVKIEHGYVRHWEEFAFLPNIVDWIRLFNSLDFLVIVVTNQRGVALGLMTEDDLKAIHEKMIAELALEGARVDDVFACPHHSGVCGCRKPKPGLVDQARARWDIDLAGSLLIGDSDSDAELASACGLRFLRAGNGRLVLN